MNETADRPLPVVSREAWLGLAVATSAAFLVVIDVSVVNVALPSIAADLDASTTDLSWVVSGYNIALASLLLLAGRLADWQGRRRIFMLGLVGFLAGSALCGLADSVEFLIGARVVQAVGGALLTPASLAMVLPQFPLEKRGVAIGLWGAMGALGAAFGPSVGALLIEASDWRLIFLINIPLGIIVIIAASRLVAETRDETAQGPLDLIGVPIGVVGVALMMWGIVRSESLGWSDSSVLGLVVVGLVLLPVVVWRSARHPAPLLDLSLFRGRPFSVATGAFWFYSMGFTAGFLLNSFMLQRLWGMSVLETGFALTPGPIVGALSSAPLGSLADRIGHRWVVTGGALLCSGSYVWLLTQSTAKQEFVAVFLPANLVLGLGVGATIAGLQSAAMSEIGPQQFASANATIRTMQQVGYAIGISVVLTLAADLDLGGFRSGYLWVAVCYALAALVVAAGYPSGTAASRTATAAGVT
ncbi:MAG: DHA2 family efflux MFS transporter permease subunit [Acidimicrobiales bacterium]|jgi:EmrB/QacA subfamily drug resistance transporter|nr:DHA2 family efflux MFS transporter permease subunit [Acidimicrobiales bacterium]